MFIRGEPEDRWEGGVERATWLDDGTRTLVVGDWSINILSCEAIFLKLYSFIKEKQINKSWFKMRIMVTVLVSLFSSQNSVWVCVYICIYVQIYIYLNFIINFSGFFKAHISGFSVLQHISGLNFPLSNGRPIFKGYIYTFNLVHIHIHEHI